MKDLPGFNRSWKPPALIQIKGNRMGRGGKSRILTIEERIPAASRRNRFGEACLFGPGPLRYTTLLDLHQGRPAEQPYNVQSSTCRNPL